MENWLKNATGAMTPATSIMCTASAPSHMARVPGMTWHTTVIVPLRSTKNYIYILYIYLFVFVLFPINDYNTFQPNACIHIYI